MSVDPEGQHHDGDLQSKVKDSTTNEQADVEDSSQDDHNNAMNHPSSSLPLGTDDNDDNVAVNRDVSSTVQVAVRIRPLLAMEGDSDICIKVSHGDSTNIPNALQIGGTSGPRFTFDYVYGTHVRQSEIYATKIDPLVNSCLEGYNATVLAYGQTGSGKTYTVMGADSVHDTKTAGVIPRAIQSIFTKLQAEQAQAEKDKCNDEEATFSFQIKLQFLELYGEEIRDLLVPTSGGGNTTHKLTIRDLGTDEPEVVGATHQVVQSPEEALLALTHGMVRRVTGATAMNQSSSRSHAILSLLIEQQRQVTMTTTTTPVGTETTVESRQDDKENEEEIMVQVKRSRFNFVDLAGSERQKRTQAEGQRLKEGIDINKGLLVLGNVISALGDPQKRGSFVPYRDSKLTRLLKGSLGGNHKTLMIACVSPSSDNMDESLNCLRYANRAKNIQNNAIVNIDANTRRITQLQQQVQALASDLLRSWDGEDTEGKVFTREILQALTAGDETVVGSFHTTTPTKPRLSVITPASVTTSTKEKMDPVSTLPSPDGVTPQDQAQASRIHELEVELSRTRDQLRESQANHDAAEEQLYVSKAENELYQLQMSVLTPKGSGSNRSVSTNMSNGGTSSDDVPGTISKSAFLERAKEYESEIGKLKAQLRDAQAKASAHLDWMGGNLHEDASIEKAKLGLEKDRERLAHIQSTLSSTNPSGDQEEPLHLDDDDASSGSLDREEQAERAKLTVLTRKYLGGDSDDEHDVIIGEDNQSLRQQEDAEDQENDELSPQMPDRRQRHLQADLVELSRNIAAKEDLIGQLRLSQEKYASMRDFYEERLKQMESTLSEKEAEREELIVELARARDSNEEGKHLEIRLKEKESHIASLRKKQKELLDLTRVSSRNHTEISRLQSEVKTMKKRKVDLQKQLGQERKHHALEKRQLQKDAIQKDRELTKWKKVSTQREVQAQKANQVAKARLEEIGNLRNKYKDVEKKLRVMSLKRGVMEKAGLDPVIVGRRDWNPPGQDQSSRVTTRSNKKVSIDTDALRDHLDQKVAEVVRKEAIVDKLAHEWEEHFELTSKRSELSEAVDAGAEEELQSLDLKIQFKEDRIRQLAQRLTKQKDIPKQGNPLTDTFLFSAEFRKICPGSSTDSLKKVILVLFGMVVRERRRIAALARTASSLDERAQAAEKAAESHEEALRTYISEQRRESAAMTQSQQEQILSLMDFVKDSGENVDLSEQGFDNTNGVDPKLWVLAVERASLLEKQLSELRAEADAAESYRSRLEELHANLNLSNQENEDYQEDISGLRAVLRQIREIVVNSGHGGRRETDHANAAVLEIINDVLHKRHVSVKKPKRKAPSESSGKGSRRMLSPRVKKHFELMHTSDSGEDVDTPEWASSIMTDLALIAQGKVPSSLGGVGDVEDQSAILPSADSAESKPSDSALTVEVSKSHSPRSRKDRNTVTSKGISTALEKVVIPDVPDSFAAGENVPDKAESSYTTPLASTSQVPNTQKSVFERLVSPSAYTGTQKDRFQSKQTKRTRPPKDAATKLLDDLLQSDNERVESNERGAVSKTLSDYTQQDVFERLQRTTTQAYAVKHDGTVPVKAFEEREHISPTPSIKGGAASVDTNGRAAPSVPTLADRPASRYTSQDVFERLQKTTTEAYAKKTSASARHDHH